MLGGGLEGGVVASRLKPHSALEADWWKFIGAQFVATYEARLSEIFPRGEETSPTNSETFNFKF